MRHLRYLPIFCAGLTVASCVEFDRVDVEARRCVSDEDCTGFTLCVRGFCQLECLISDDCPPSTPLCHLHEYVCVECMVDGDCSTGFCDLNTNTCQVGEDVDQDESTMDDIDEDTEMYSHDFDEDAAEGEDEISTQETEEDATEVESTLADIDEEVGTGDPAIRSPYGSLTISFNTPIVLHHDDDPISPDGFLTHPFASGAYGSRCARR